MSNINQLLYKTFPVVRADLTDEEHKLYFVDENGDGFVFYHEQDCCEQVQIVDIIGDLSDLENAPLVEAEEVTESGESEEDESYTWTFYKFRTAKGSVTVRWYGTSNGYYSETVNLEKCKNFKFLAWWEEDNYND